MFLELLIALLILTSVATIVFLKYIVLPLLRAFYFGRYRKNPFKNTKPDSTSLSEETVVEKQLYSKSKVSSSSKYDAIIVGSGIGGLSVAAILSRAGKKVLVLEQHDIAGGACHSFMENGYEFDTGIHYLGNCSPNGITKMILDELCDSGSSIRFVLSGGDTYDQVVIEGNNPGEETIYNMKCGRLNFKKKMQSYFPHEEKAITKFLHQIHVTSTDSTDYFLLKLLPEHIAKFCFRWIGLGASYYEIASETVTDSLNQLTENANLKYVLGYIFGDFCTSPLSGSSASLYQVTDHYIRQGGYYPVGGTMELIRPIIRLIEASGGKVLVRAKVSEILVENNMAVGVRIERDGHCIYADRIISDAGVKATYQIIPRNILQSNSKLKYIKEQRLDRLPTSVQHFYVFVGLKASQEELQLPGHNVWIYPSHKGRKTNYFDSVEEYFQQDSFDYNKGVPLMFISFPSAKDPMYEHRVGIGKSVALVILPARYEWFARCEDDHSRDEFLTENRVRQRSEEYRDLKRDMTDYGLQMLQDYFPQISNEIVGYIEGGTPLTSQYYFNSPKGSSYGSFDMNVARFKELDDVLYLRPGLFHENGVENLHITGQDIVHCGFGGALYSGLLCASSILKRDLYSDLREVWSSTMKTTQ